MIRKLSEEELKQWCICEEPNCPKEKIRHFERCKVCGSEAFHLTLDLRIDEHFDILNPQFKLLDEVQAKEIINMPAEIK
jgi:hypothetical protein